MKALKAHKNISSESPISRIERYMQVGDLDQAQQACMEVLRQQPDHLRANYILGAIMLLKRDYEKSEELLCKVVQLEPNHADAHNNIGVIYLRRDKDSHAAEQQFKKALEYAPDHSGAISNLGNVYLKRGELDLAEDLYRRGLHADPRSALCMHNLGTLLVNKKRFAEAADYLKQAIRIWPDNAQSYMKLGDALSGMKDMAESIKLMERILQLKKPGVAVMTAYSVAKKICRWDITEKLTPMIVQLLLENRSDEISFQVTLIEMLADPRISNDVMFKIHQITARSIQQKIEEQPFTSYEQALGSIRQLKIGYLSSDFRNHVVNYHMHGLVDHYDRSLFKVYCYSNTKNEDSITEKYKSKADVFVNVCELTDAQLAQRIHEDGIHILLDMNGYTRDSRIAVMCYRPAPIQITYLGYPFSSGMECVNYTISDTYLDGPLNAKYCSETPLRLPEAIISFGALYKEDIDSVIPLERNQYVTFGSLINNYKLNRDVIRVWAAILTRTPYAKMILNHPNYALDCIRENILNEFARHGIAAERLKFAWDKHPTATHLRYYNDIDIALDPFPMTGGQTTVDAVWMGVPVVTLVGDAHHERLSYSVLNNIGINVEELAAFTREDYVDKAVALANRPERIKELRRLIPARLKESILCNPARFTRQMEAAYMEVWNEKFKSHTFNNGVQPQQEYVPVHGGVDLAVPGSLEDPYSYIVREQSGWYDPEYRFVCDNIQAGMRVVDVNPEMGMYAIPVAKKITDKGMLWAYAVSDSDRQWLQKSGRHNCISNLRIFAKEPTTLGLDEERSALGLNDIHFVRLNVAGDVGAGLLNRSKAFFTDNSPLVMFGVKGDSGTDLSLVPLFKELGYDLYRLIPGLNLLAPYTSAEDLDIFATNLFACKAGPADCWAGRNLLIRATLPLAALPGVHESHWQDYLKDLPYARGLIAGWQNSCVHVPEWEVYHVALNLFALAKNSAADPDYRYACLQTCFSILVMLNQAHPSLPRLLSLTRVMIEMGKREQAVNLLNQLIGFFQADTVAQIDEPFLALSDDFAAMNPGDKLGDWIVASVIGQRELSRGLSTYFLGRQSLDMLRVVQGTGFISQELERRLQLLETRHARVNEMSSQVA